MLRIEKRSERSGEVVFSLSGRLQSEEVPEVRKLITTGDERIVIDLKEVKQVDRSSVKFLIECESNGIEVRNASPYIREWISRETSSNPVSSEQVE